MAGRHSGAGRHTKVELTTHAEDLGVKPQREQRTWYGRMTKRNTTLSYNVLKELPNTKAPATLTDESEMRMGVTWTLKMSRYGRMANTCMTAPMSFSSASITSSLSCRVLERFLLSLHLDQAVSA
jgi:hypothetical protein